MWRWNAPVCEHSLLHAVVVPPSPKTSEVDYFLLCATSVKRQLWQ